MNEEVKIPEVVLQIDSYIELNTQQRNSFSNRLNFYLLSATNVLQTKITDNLILNSVIDDIELDTTSINTSYSDVDTGVSIFKINTSWTFYSDVSVLHEQLDNEIKENIENASNIPFCSFDEICDWLNQWALLVKRELTAFSTAESYDAAIAHLLIVHALMGLASCVTALSRLNPAIC